MKGPEKKFEDRLRKFLTEAGCLVIKLHGHAAQSGLPDLMVIGPDGLTRFIEVKALKRKNDSPVAKLSGKQVARLRKLAKAKAPVFVVGGDAGSLHEWEDNPPWATVEWYSDRGEVSGILYAVPVDEACKRILLEK